MAPVPVKSFTTAVDTLSAACDTRLRPKNTTRAINLPPLNSQFGIVFIKFDVLCQFQESEGILARTTGWLNFSLRGVTIGLNVVLCRMLRKILLVFAKECYIFVPVNFEEKNEGTYKSLFY